MRWCRSGKVRLRVLSQMTRSAKTMRSSAGSASASRPAVDSTGSSPHAYTPGNTGENDRGGRLWVG